MSGLVLGSPGLHLLILTVQWQDSTSGARMVRLIVTRTVAGVSTTVAEAEVWSTPTTVGGKATMQAILQHIAQPGDLVVPVVRQTTGANLEVNSAKTMLQISRLAQ